ncbi:MAG: putative acetyltransferase [Haloarculaceae archaeon]|jgi:putative acetyltransferase
MTDPPITRVVEDATGDRFRITPLVANHFDSLVRMYREFSPDERSFGLPPRDEDDLEAWLARLDQEGRSFVAVRDGAVGQVAYTPVSADRPDFVVFVDPEVHGRGIGTALVTHAVERAAAENIDGFISYVERDNESAISLYEKTGFEVYSREPTTIKMGMTLERDVDEDTDHVWDSIDG